MTQERYRNTEEPSRCLHRAIDSRMLIPDESLVTHLPAIHSLVAQRKERQVPILKAGGSTPSEAAVLDRRPSVIAGSTPVGPIRGAVPVGATPDSITCLDNNAP